MFILWGTFIVYFAIIPAAIVLSQISKLKQLSDKKALKDKWIVLVKSIIDYWLPSFFILSIILNSLPWQFIFGILSVINILYSLTKTFLTANKIEMYQRCAVVHGFLLCLVLTVYLIYKIPQNNRVVDGVIIMDNSLQNIITTIIAAVYGGLLTLAGVAWTIRSGNKDRMEERKQFETDRKEEERKRFIPYLMIKNNEQYNYTMNVRNINELEQDCYFSKNASVKYIYRFLPFLVKNISDSNIVFNGISIHNTYLPFSNRLMLPKGDITAIVLSISPLVLYAPIEKMDLIVEDVLGNEYSVPCEVYFERKSEFTSNFECDCTFSVPTLGIPKLKKREN